MTKILFVILVLSFFHTSYSQEISDVNGIYINGMATSFEEALESKKSIQSYLNNPDSNIKKYNFDIKLSYNATGEGTNSSLDRLYDIQELRTSKKNEENYFNLLSSIIASHYSNSVNLSKSIAGVINTIGYQQEEDSIKVAIKTAVNNIKSNDKTLVIGYSQGNIISNLSWIQLVNEFGDEAFNKVRVVNIGNTSAFSPNKLNLTHESDEALDWLQSLGALYNRDTSLCVGVCEYLKDDSTFSAVSGGDDLNHALFETYLSDLIASPIIDQGIEKGINNQGRMKDWFEDIIYNAVESLERANSTEPVFKSVSLVSIIKLDEYISFSGSITADSSLSHISIVVKNSDGESTLKDVSLDGLSDSYVLSNIDITDMFDDIGEYEVRLSVTDENDLTSLSIFDIEVIPNVNSISVSPDPVDIGDDFKLSVSGEKLTTDVKAYVVGGSECTVATPTNDVFVEFDCTAPSPAQNYTYVVYYKDKSESAYELDKKEITVIDPLIVEPGCTTGQTQACSTVSNGANIQACGNDETWGDCSISCDSGYEVSGTSCVIQASQNCTPNDTDSQTCSITNGTGSQSKTCSADGSDWTVTTCTVQSCDSGYEESGNSCVEESAEVGVPSNLIAVPSADGTAVTVGWLAVDGADTYKIRLLDNDGDDDRYIDDLTVSALNIFELTPGHSYKFKVKAIIDNDDGSYSDYVSFDTPLLSTSACYLSFFTNSEITESLVNGNWDTDVGGSKTQVRQLQYFLNALGFDIGSDGADGKFGDDTESAVRSYQSANSIEVDGLVGPTTRNTINTSCD